MASSGPEYAIEDVYGLLFRCRRLQLLLMAVTFRFPKIQESYGNFRHMEYFNPEVQLGSSQHLALLVNPHT